MQHYEEKHIPAMAARVIKVEGKVTCDICSSVLCQGGFDVNETEIRRRTGEVYPEFGSGKEVTADLCGDCFDSKLIPWLESQGVTMTTEEWDY